MKPGALFTIMAAVVIAGAALRSVPAQAQPACAALDGTVGPDQVCHARSSTANYSIDISFPVDYPDQQAVTSALKRGRDEFTDWVARFGPGAARGGPYQYIVTGRTYRSGTPDAGTESLVLTIDNDTGLANEGHPNTTFEAFNFDFAKRSPITFATLFKPGSDPLPVLNAIVQREFETPPEDLAVETYQNFAITDYAVIFFFAQNQVAQDNNGPHSVAVPRTQLASLLA